MKRIRIRVPCSTANFGSGFDTLGAALSLWLVVTAFKDSHWTIKTSCSNISLDYEENLITKTALFLCRKYSISLEPLNIMIENEIPLSRGLGSSGAAIVAGLALGNYFGDLNLDSSQLLGRIHKLIY
jgi:homoserine kinase